MEEKRNFDKENNNNTNPKQQQQKDKSTIENDQYQKSKSGPPPPPYQANDNKKQTNEVTAQNANQRSLQHTGRPATLLIVPKFYEDKQNNNNNNINNNNNVENQSHTFRDTLLLNTKTRRHTDQEYGCLYSADATQFNKKRDYDNNNKGQSIDTLNTAYTYQGTTCTSESMLTIGGVTLNQGSHSFDLESNFSRMVLGSQGTSSTLSAMNGINGRRSRKRDLLNFAHFLQTPRAEALQQPIRAAHNIWFESQARTEHKPQIMPPKQVELKKSAEKKEKKKRLGPPPQVRNQASRQMDDPLANRPRTHTKDKSKKEQKNEFPPLKAATANEKYYPLNHYNFFCLKKIRTFCLFNITLYNKMLLLQYYLVSDRGLLF